MTIFNVVPCNSVNDIQFGMTREEVRALIGKNYKEFRKTKFSKTTTDDYKDFHVYYDKDDKCEAVEIFRDSEVYVKGKKVFPASIEEVKNLFPDLINDEEGSYTSIENSVGIQCEDNEMVTILFGTTNYYK